MAYIKQCDRADCHRELGQDEFPFLQIHGSVSEQVDVRYGGVEYRYLTPHKDAKLAFCDADCFAGWVQEQKGFIPFVRRGGRTLIHRHAID